ncbi:DAK2 domain-containing protein, partial [Actinotalea sp. JY-7885]
MRTVVVDAALLRAWSRSATAQLRAASQELDDLNVFPVPDGDTGTNLLLTLAEATRGADAGGPGVHACARALLRGALVGARGSSGVIVSQYLRGLLGALVAPEGGEGAPVRAPDPA